MTPKTLLIVLLALAVVNATYVIEEKEYRPPQQILDEEGSTLGEIINRGYTYQPKRELLRNSKAQLERVGGKFLTIKSVSFVIATTEDSYTYKVLYDQDEWYEPVCKMFKNHVGKTKLAKIEFKTTGALQKDLGYIAYNPTGQYLINSKQFFKMPEHQKNRIRYKNPCWIKEQAIFRRAPNLAGITNSLDASRDPKSVDLAYAKECQFPSGGIYQGYVWINELNQQCATEAEVMELERSNYSSESSDLPFAPEPEQDGKQLSYDGGSKGGK